MEQHFKILLPAICATCIAATAHAQDKIYKTTGETTDAKITFVGNKVIRYVLPDGHKHGILKNDIAFIVYQNGAKDFFSVRDTSAIINDSIGRAARIEKRNKNYGKNIFSFTSAYAQSSDRTINDPGMGLSYERLLGRRGFISINIPVTVCLSTPKDYNNSIVQNNTGWYYYNGDPVFYTGTYSACYFAPGIKFYFAPDTRKVRYSIGASFLGILGNEPLGVHFVTYNNYNNYSNSFTATYHYAMYGFMLSNSLNIMASEHLLIALDLGVGIPEADNRYTDDNGGAEKILSTFIQGGLKIGYRY